MIEIKNVTKKYGNYVAVEDIASKLRNRRFTVLSAITAQAKPHF